jgi:hypothetical protein
MKFNLGYAISFFIATLLLPLTSQAYIPSDSEPANLIPPGAYLELKEDLTLGSQSREIVFHKGQIVNSSVVYSNSTFCVLKSRFEKNYGLKVIRARYDGLACDSTSCIELSSYQHTQINSGRGGLSFFNTATSSNFHSFYCYNGEKSHPTIGEVREAIGSYMNLVIPDMGVSYVQELKVMPSPPAASGVTPGQK